MGVIIQASSFIMLLFQSIILPGVIGFNNYGIAVSAVLPLFLVVAILESFFVKVLDESKSYNIFLYSLIFSCLLFFVFLILGNSFVDIVFLSFLSLFFIFSMCFKFIFYSYREYGVIAYVELVSVFIYILTLVLCFFLNFLDYYVYYVSLIGYSFFSLFLYLIAINKLKIKFSKERISLGFLDDLFKAISWKSYQVYINIFLLFFVSLFYSVEYVGVLKVVFSVLSGFKFIIPFTLPMFSNLVNQNLNYALLKIYKILFLLILISVILFHIGWFFSNNILYFRKYEFIFDDVMIFVAYPIVILSTYFASILIKKNKSLLLFLISTFSFSVTLVLCIFFKNYFGLNFLIGAIFYQLMCFFYIWKMLK